jgi:signal transduction histidine kinase
LPLLRAALAAAQAFEHAHAELEARRLVLAKLCHDIRSPLHVVHGYTEIVRDDPKAAPFEHLLTRLDAAVDTAIGLVQNYVDLARLSTPGFVRYRERVDVDEILDEVRDAAVRQIGSRPLRFVTSVPAEGGYLYVDGEILRAVLLELVRNAVKFTAVGTIRLYVRTTGERTIFSVADSGPGIPDSDLLGLFVPFQQRADTRITSTPGQGVGLAMAERLSALMGGALAVTRTGPSGTTLTLSVPGRLQFLRTSVQAHVLH